MSETIRAMERPVMSILALLNSCQETFLDFKVRVEPDIALEWSVKIVGGYQMERIVKACNKLIPPMSFAEGNPNNGHSHHKFIVGNEGSEVLYLEIVKGYLPKDFDYNGLGKQLNMVGGACKADEYTIIENNEHTFKYRFWFD